MRYTRAQSQRRRARRDSRARSADTTSGSTSLRRSASALCRILPGRRPQKRRGPDGRADRGLAESRFPEGCLNQPSELTEGLIRNDAIQSEHAQTWRARQRFASDAISDATGRRARQTNGLVLNVCVGMHKGCAVYSRDFNCQANYNRFARLSWRTRTRSSASLRRLPDPGDLRFSPSALAAGPIRSEERRVG